MMYDYKKILAIFIPILGIIALIIHFTQTFNSLGVYIFEFSLSFLIIFIALLFAKKEVFRIWSKFAVIIVPISTVLILISPSIGDPLRLVFDKKEATFFLAIQFLVMSVVLILTKSFRPTWRLWIILPITFILSAIIMIIAAIVL